MSNSSTTPLFEVKRIDSPGFDTISKNGVQKQVHSVIKNIPFTAELGSATSTPINFHNVGLIEAKLLYDDPHGEEEKEVGYVRLPPLDYQCRINEPKGETVIVDLKLSVLSSQHEDSLFIIKFYIQGGPSVCTDPIRVVSKPSQVHTLAQGPKRKKRPNTTDSMKETLSRIENNQKEHSVAIEGMLKVLSTLTQNVQRNAIIPTDEEPRLPQKRARIEPEETEETKETPSELFEKHLNGLVSAFHAIDENQRVDIVRKVMHSSPIDFTEKVSDVIACISLEGLRREIGGANVITGSPYEQQFEPFNPSIDLDTFCGDFFNIAPLEGDLSC